MVTCVFLLPSTSLRCWMIKTSGDDSGPATIRAQREWSRSSARCRWGSTTAGIRFSSTCRTSRGEHMGPITQRHCAYRWACRYLMSLYAPSFFLLTLNLLSSQIHANCRIRRVYFSDRLYSEDELPAEFKLYLPVQNQKTKVRAHFYRTHLSKSLN